MFETIFNIICVVLFSCFLGTVIIFSINYFKDGMNERFLFIIPAIVILALILIGDYSENIYRKTVNETMHEIYNETSMDDVKEDIDQFFYEREYGKDDINE